VTIAELSIVPLEVPLKGGEAKEEPGRLKERSDKVEKGVKNAILWKWLTG